MRYPNTDIVKCSLCSKNCRDLSARYTKANTYINQNIIHVFGKKALVSQHVDKSKADADTDTEIHE